VRRRIQALSRLGLYLGLAIAWVGPAHAESNPLITEPTDFWFEYTEPTRFIARTFQSGDLPSDPMLWLYNDATGQLIFENDDSLGLQSNIEIDLDAGRYRLRAGTCCGDPNAWRDGVVWNVRYELSFNGIQSNPTTTTELTTTTEPETTTTTSTTTTTTQPATTSTTTQPATTTTVEPTTTTSEVTTSLPQEASTTTTQAELPTTTSSLGTEPSTTSPTTSTTSTITPTPPNVTTTTSSTSTTTTTVASTTGTTTAPTTAPTTTAPATDEAVLPENPTAEDVVAFLEEVTTEQLADLSVEETTQLIEDIANADLTPEQALQVAEALSGAPDEVKEQFEETINVFSGQFDTYVPSGSTVSVGTRRAVVAVTAVTFLLPAPVPTTRRSP